MRLPGTAWRMMVSRLLTSIVAAATLSVALAIDLPTHASLTLVSSDGVVLGVGQVAGGDVILTLQAGAAGDVKLLIVGDDGEILAFDAVITERGEVMVVRGEIVEDLAAAVRARGGSVLVTIERPDSEANAVATVGRERDDGTNGAPTQAGASEGDAPGGAVGDAPPAESPETADPPAEDPEPTNPPGDDRPTENPPAEAPPAEEPPPNDPPAESPPDENPNEGPNENAGENPNK